MTVKLTEIKTYLIASPQVDYGCLLDYLSEIGAPEWLTPEKTMHTPPAELLTEVGGRLCYKSFAIGLNPNVTRIREDELEYHQNILRSGHGSVLQHANFTFITNGCSRILTHELVRHAVGVTHSQESMRYVRLDDIPMWIPQWAQDDDELYHQLIHLVEHSEELILWMTEHFKLDDPSTNFDEKKKKTSFMRRFAPAGHSTAIMSTINIRALRHIIHLRSSIHAEEEIRAWVDQIAHTAMAAIPNIMHDFHANEHLEYIPEFVRV